MVQRETAALMVARQVSLFQQLNDIQLQGVSSQLAQRHYPKGTILFQEGDEANYLYIVCRGRVRIYLSSPDGREATVRIYRPYNTFGEIAVLDGAPRSASAVALDDVISLLLHRSQFHALLRENFDLVMHMFSLLTERLRYTTDYSQHLAFLDGPGRVAAALLQLASVEAKETGSIRLDLTQQELATFTSTTREWVNRALRDFAKDGLIRLERGAIVVLDREGLRRKVG